MICTTIVFNVFVTEIGKWNPELLFADYTYGCVYAHHSQRLRAFSSPLTGVFVIFFQVFRAQNICALQTAPPWPAAITLGLSLSAKLNPRYFFLVSFLL